MPIAMPLGFNQLRPAMTVNPNGTTISTAVGNPVGGTRSMLFSGTNYPIMTPTNTSVSTGGFNFGVNTAWTIETFIYVTAYPTGTNKFIFEISYGGPTFAMLTNGKIHVAQSFVTDMADSTFSPSLNTWHHICLCQYPIGGGATMNLYIDGTANINFGTTGTNWGQTTHPYSYIGSGNGAGYGPWVGYQCETRVSSIARYTTPFITVPNKPFVDDPYTLLLVHGDAINGSNAVSDDNT